MHVDMSDYRKNYMKEWHKNNPEYNKDYRKQYHSENGDKIKKQHKDSHLKRKYGIDSEAYNQMFNEQEGKCKICGTHQSELSKSLAVDHCHTTGKVRGLLCMHCNQALGKFKDNIKSLENAIIYLKDHVTTYK